MNHNQPDICQDIFSNMRRLLSQFQALSTAPNTSFSHSEGYQTLSPSVSQNADFGGNWSDSA